MTYANSARFFSFSQLVSHFLLNPAVSECRSIKRCQGGVGAVSGRCQLTLVSECRGGVRLVSGSVRQCQAILTVPTCVQCQWCQSCQDRASEKGPRGQFGPTRSPDVNECSHRVVWVIWPCDNTQFTLGISWGRTVHVVPFHWPIGPVLPPLTPLTLYTHGQCQYGLWLDTT